MSRRLSRATIACVAHAVMFSFVRASFDDVRARAVRLYVADGGTCARGGTMSDESLDDAEGGERRIERWSESEGLDACENHRAGLFLGSSKTDARAEERVTASEALGLAETLANETTIELWFKNELSDNQGEGVSVPFFTVRHDVYGTEWIGLSVQRSGTTRVFGTGAPPTSFTVKDFGKNVTNLILTMDFTAVKVYVDSLLVLQFPRGNLCRIFERDARANVLLGGHSEDVEDAWWRGFFYVIVIYPFAVNEDVVKRIYAEEISKIMPDVSIRTRVIDINADPTNAVFGVPTNIAPDLERLDVMCDENESACDLSIHSFVNIRELPTYGALHVCEHEEIHLKREEEVELNALCYTATSVPRGVNEETVRFNDSVTFQITGDDESPWFRVSVDVAKGVLSCAAQLVMTEDTTTTTTLQIMDSDAVNETMSFELLDTIDHVSLSFENGTHLPVRERIVGNSCNMQPKCKLLSNDDHIHRACLDILVIPRPDYFNSLQSPAFSGPEYPPWPVKVASVAFRGWSGNRRSQTAVLNITVKNEIDAPQLAVNRTIFYAEYLRRERVGTFSVSTSDYDSRVSRVSIVSARSNLLAISNLTALALCEYPFVLGDGSGNAEIVLFAAPSVVESILNSLVYIHLKRGETQDQILIEVDEASVVLIALLQNDENAGRGE